MFFYRSGAGVEPALTRMCESHAVIRFQMLNFVVSNQKINALWVILLL